MRLYCDYNSATEDGRYSLAVAGTMRDLKALGVELRAGMAVTLYMDDRDQKGEPVVLLVDAIVEKEGSHFFARADKRTWREEKLQGSAVYRLRTSCSSRPCRSNFLPCFLAVRQPANMVLQRIIILPRFARADARR